jgi:hypothetical protein
MEKETKEQKIKLKRIYYNTIDAKKVDANSKMNTPDDNKKPK